MHKIDLLQHFRTCLSSLLTKIMKTSYYEGLQWRLFTLVYSEASED